MRALIFICFCVPLWLSGQVTEDSLGCWEDSSKIKLVRLQVNSTQSDFAPQVVNNQLVFASARDHHYGIVYAPENQQQPATDLFYASKSDSVTFGSVKPLDAINSKYNEGPFTVSKDGNSIYFSTNARESSAEKGPKALQIYTAQKTKGRWQKPVAAPFCNAGFASCHPALAPGNKLVFASDMPGGFGGMDLYVTEYKNGAWSAPVNMGSSINSKANDIFPFVSANNLLFFSSDRQTGLGGLDLYELDMNDPLEKGLVHMPQPVNSASDDFGIWTDSLGQSGYVCSNREPGYSDDIYYFYTAVPDFDDAPTPAVKQSFCFAFFEETSLGSQDTSHMTYEWNFGDGSKARSLKARHCYQKPGHYKVELNIVEASSGELFYNETSYDLAVDPPKQLSILAADTAAMGQPMVLDASASALKGYSLVRYYWMFGDKRYNSGPVVKHIYRESGCYTVELGVLAKNDTTGKIEKFKLSRKIIVRDHT